VTGQSDSAIFARSMTSAAISRDRERDRTRWGQQLLLGALALIGLAHCAYHLGYTVDDAYISFRYARNAAHGLGLVYNAGEYVKGYSNTLVTLLCVAPASFGADPSGFVKALSLAGYLAMLWLIARRWTRNALSGSVAIACLAISTPVAVWFSAGLETGLYTALLVLAVTRRLLEQQHGGGAASGVLFGLVSLSRPEGVLFWIAALAHDLVFRRRLRPFSRSDLAFYLLPPLCCATELIVSQLYYGTPLPQTYYAKIAPALSFAGRLASLWAGALAQLGQDGYLRRAVSFTLGSQPMILLAPALLALFHRQALPHHAACLLMLLTQVVFISVAQEDWMPAGRFIVPMMPFLAILIGEGIGALDRVAGPLRRAGWPLAAAAIALLAYANIGSSRTVHGAMRLNAAAKLEDGRVYARLVEAGAALSSFDIGGQGYAAAGLDLVDTYGLTDRHTARCWTRALVCARYAELVRPELIRRHPKAKDAFMTRNIKHEYLVLAKRGSLRIAKTAVLRDAVPPTAASAAVEFPSGLKVEGYESPSHVRRDRGLELELYWSRRRTVKREACGRRVELRDAAGRVRSTGTDDWLWCYAPDSRQWKAGVFADRVVLDRVASSGQFSIWVVHEGIEARLGSVVVVEPEAADTMARELLRRVVAQGRGSPIEQRFALLRQANALGADRLVHGAYQRAAVARARLLLPADLARRPPEAQLGALKAERRVLLRAAWEVPFVGRSLRQALDQNGARRAALIDRLLAQLG